MPEFPHLSPEVLQEIREKHEQFKDSTDEEIIAAVMPQLMAALQERSEDEQVEPVLQDFSIEGVAAFIREKDCKKIIVMTGAGISTAAGIPDFRSPVTGLYDNLQKYELPFPEAIFTLDYFRERPEPFFTLAKEMWPGKYRATKFHCFIKLLAEKGVLLRNYTQNIDGLEWVAGVPDDKIIAAHGTFEGAHCIEDGCHKEHSKDYVRERCVEVEGPPEPPRCTKCSGLVKPDIVFFGEGLPPRFRSQVRRDFRDCDLLIVAGTSLTVHPFAGLVAKVPKDVPRLVLNNQEVGEDLGMVYSGPRCRRDVLARGCCQENAQTLADTLGWGAELREIQAHFDARFDAGELDPRRQAAAGAAAPAADAKAGAAAD
eukprot:TRINITY_DN1295_c0_g1_i3.p1 TRINITY_DN1295_c0_g1~~TRINITY_DN1295_c0_g1_i3.p1  ORF type:complete len:371 (+),score=131.86 TRINITY_DN1295_c0_g1_i3:131-1243(+)